MDKSCSWECHHCGGMNFGEGPCRFCKEEEIEGKISMGDEGKENEKLEIQGPFSKHQIEIKCPCGNTSNIDIDFHINIVGMIEFKCNKCGEIQDTGGSIRKKFVFEVDDE